MISSNRICFLLIALILATASAFAPTNAARRFDKSRSQLNLLGVRNKAAKTKEEDLELTRAIIMKHVEKLDTKSIMDDDDDDDDEKGYIGNVISDAKVSDDVNGGADALETIKSIGKKIKMRFTKSQQ
ncbi:hypothetical protein HJC23_002289 [Cyclotella cryptica]|uniref:RxLR effector protein n=1 Tax=Cyclotella cryptica TaxID=29204 RepID=A0ABD3QI26_9STRA|eukprot:CCRYP_005759-RA/>CCRYP_005759-RA protein AED:0.32 eAED:0.32 QI:0/-1/0/1/-1/1/1/0/127